MEKKTIVLIGTVIIAIVFISSIAAFGNGNSNTTSTTTITRSTTFVAGSANVVVSGYSQTLAINIAQQAQNSSAIVSSLLDSMLANNIINNFFPEGAGFIVYLGNVSAYNLSTTISAAVGNAPVSFNATVKARLPQSITLYNSGRPLHVQIGNSTYPFSTSKLMPIGSNVSVNIQAIVYQNTTMVQNLGGPVFSVYNGNLKLTPT
jgi:hypothetical protein